MDLLSSIDWGVVFQGGGVLTSMYLAFQIKGALANHEKRLEALEASRGISRRRAKPARPHR